MSGRTLFEGLLFHCGGLGDIRRAERREAMKKALYGAILSVAITILNVSSALAQVTTGYQELVGKTFWCTKAEVPGFDCDGEARYAPHKIVGYRVNLVEYEIETNGIKRTFLAGDVGKAILYGHLVPYDPVKKQEEDAAKATAASAKRVASIKAKKWPSQIEQAVIEKKIRMGMTEEQVIAAWGKPAKINKTVGSWGLHEQWVYDTSNYLYFENGMLKSWQTTRSP